MSLLLFGNTNAAAQAPVTLPTVSAAPQAVYGTTLLVAGYTGYCVRVSRASDNAQLDIGFVNGRIDMGAALAFAGGSELTVVIWYDQSGNAYNVTNATVANQPRLRSANAWRGLQGLLFDGFNATSGGTQIAKTLAFPAGVTINRQSQTAFLVNGVKATGAGNAVLEMGVLATRALPFTGVGNTGLSILTGSTGMLTTRLPRSNPSVNAWRMGAAASKVYVEDDISTSGAAQAAGSSTAGQFGSTVSGATFNHRGEIYAFVAYTTALSDGDVTIVNAALKSAYSCDYSQANLIMVEGDSISEGTNDTYMMNNIRQCYPNLISDAHIYNMAVHGTTAATEYARRVVKINSVDRTVTGTKIFICGLGSNDISGGTTAANLWTNTILPYIQYAQSRGYSVIVGTITPRTGFSAPVEIERLAYNALVLANAVTYSYSVADYCAQPEFDTQADAANTTYFSTDGVHPTTAGYAVMASVLYPVINTLLV